MRRFSVLAGSIIALLRVSSAEAGPYRELEGDVAIILQDPRSLAVAEEGDMLVGLGELMGMDISAETCVATAKTVQQILNDPSDPKTYVPSTATCSQVSVTDTPWLYVPAEGDGFAWTTLPPGSYYGIVVHVTDNEAVATAREGRAKVALAKLLGMSVGGRVNEKLIQGIAARLQARKVPFFCSTLSR